MGSRLGLREACSGDAAARRCIAVGGRRLESLVEAERCAGAKSGASRDSFWSGSHVAPSQSPPRTLTVNVFDFPPPPSMSSNKVQTEGVLLFEQPFVKVRLSRLFAKRSGPVYLHHDRSRTRTTGRCSASRSAMSKRNSVRCNLSRARQLPRAVRKPLHQLTP